MKAYPYSDDLENHHDDFLEFLKHQANAEWGGYRIYDGSGNHLQQNPLELTDFILALRKHEKSGGFQFKKFLEIGFSAGFTNTILNKVFHFENIVAIDTFQYTINGNALYANLRFKNLILVCGDSTSQRSINIASTFGPYDLIFIDGNHEFEIAKKDFENYKSMISPNGIIAFHDIHSNLHPGVTKLWNEIIKTNQYNSETFFCPGFPIEAGIGILSKKTL